MASMQPFVTWEMLRLFILSRCTKKWFIAVQSKRHILLLPISKNLKRNARRRGFNKLTRSRRQTMDEINDGDYRVIKVIDSFARAAIVIDFLTQRNYCFECNRLQTQTKICVATVQHMHRCSVNRLIMAVAVTTASHTHARTWSYIIVCAIQNLEFKIQEPRNHRPTRAIFRVKETIAARDKLSHHNSFFKEIYVCIVKSATYNIASIKGNNALRPRRCNYFIKLIT